MAAQANDLIAHLWEESRQSQFAALVAPTLSWSPQDHASGLGLLLLDTHGSSHLWSSTAGAAAPLGSTSFAHLIASQCSAQCPFPTLCPSPNEICRVLLLKSQCSFLYLPLAHGKVRLWQRERAGLPSCTTQPGGQSSLAPPCAPSIPLHKVPLFPSGLHPLGSKVSSSGPNSEPH